MHQGTVVVLSAQPQMQHLATEGKPKPDLISAPSWRSVINQLLVFPIESRADRPSEMVHVCRKNESIEHIWMLVVCIVKL